MIICFNCTAETKGHLDRLLASGVYRDISEVVTTAIMNQVLMEKEVEKNGSIIIGGELASMPKPAARAISPPKAPIAQQGNNNGRTSRTVSAPDGTVVKPAAATDSGRFDLPVLFRLEGFPREEPKGLAELPPDLWSHVQSIPLDRWILGQFNRVLPAKANARALVRLYLENSKGLEIAGSASQIAAQAALL